MADDALPPPPPLLLLLLLQPVLDMGPNIRTTVKPAKKKAVPAAAAAGAAGGGGGGGGTQSGVGKQLERPVVNCLRCGKIFDCRTQTGEALRFLGESGCCRHTAAADAARWLAHACIGLGLAAVSPRQLNLCATFPLPSCLSPSPYHYAGAESGGVCSFCGNHVALRYADGTSNAAEAGWAAPADPIAADPSAAASASLAPEAAAGAAAGELAGFSPEEQQGNAAGSVAYNTSSAAAVALRDRLVEYDRQSAKRTTVLDDQSDFFEIDANAWLTGEWVGLELSRGRLWVPRLCPSLDPSKGCSSLNPRPCRLPEPPCALLPYASCLPCPAEQMRSGQC